MYELLQKPRRFVELEDALGGMSPRTLTKTLRRLEKEGLIIRRRFTKPVRSYYRPTKKGTAFRKVIESMSAYGKRYL
jgi:DNA-binding HxlR family transcriptional regulator